MPDTHLKFLKSSVQVIMLSLLLTGGSVGIAYSQEASSDASAGADAASGDGSNSAGSDASAGATAGPDGSGGVTADAHGETSGSATGGDTSVSEPGISADASATSGDTPTATTSTSAGTYATSTAGNYKSAYAETDDGTVYQKLGKRRGYAIAYEEGAYSAAYYRGDTASAFSGIHSGETFTNKDARSLIRSQVKVGAYANRTEAGAWASAETYAVGSVGRRASAAGTYASASAWARTDGTAAGSARAKAAASFGKLSKRQLKALRKLASCTGLPGTRLSDKPRCRYY